MLLLLLLLLQLQGDNEGSATRPSGRRADATEPCACGPKCPARGRCRHGRRQVRPIGTVMVSRRSIAGFLNRTLARPISVRYDSPCSPRPAICQSAQQASGAPTRNGPCLSLSLSLSLSALLDLRRPRTRQPHRSRLEQPSPQLQPETRPRQQRPAAATRSSGRSSVGTGSGSRARFDGRIQTAGRCQSSTLKSNNPAKGFVENASRQYFETRPTLAGEM
jgi:hypothetical protein